MTRIAYVHHRNVFDSSFAPGIDQAGYRGLPRFVSEALPGHFEQVDRVSPMRTIPSPAAAMRILFRNYGRGKYFGWAEPSISRNFARQIRRKLEGRHADVLLFTEAKHCAFLRCPQKVVAWPDSLYVAMTELYDWGKGLCSRTLDDLRMIDQNTVDNADLLAFPCDWSAQHAIQRYGASPDKVKIIPYGANATCQRTTEDIRAMVRARSRQRCTLLFSGVDWRRKGGDVALAVTRELNESGCPAELIVIGCRPPDESALPDWVRVVGFLNKSSPEGNHQFEALHAKAHFFIMPTRADITPHVLCEANSFGLPCITSDVGGIPSMIRRGVNGRAFAASTPVADYSEQIMEWFSNEQAYEDLALSSFNEYAERLNWDVAVRTLRRYVDELT